MRTTDARRDDVQIGTIDGARFLVTPRYQGTLTEAERFRMIAGAAQTVRDVIEYDAHGAPRCTGTDCRPASHDRLASFRRELVDLLYPSLNLALVPPTCPTPC